MISLRTTWSTSLGESGFSESDSGWRALLASTGVSASDGTCCDKVRVTWNSVNGATTYEIWRNSTDDTVGGMEIARTGLTSYVDFSVARADVYYYRIKALRGDKTSGFSASDVGWTKRPVFGDYDGDGKSDLAVYHEASGCWFVLNSSNGCLAVAVFGGAGYVPASR